uniref:EMB514 n=1 Tax=Zea mays TaxID=4577 RepID=A0A804LEZ3_MAIZE
MAEPEMEVAVATAAPAGQKREREEGGDPAAECGGEETEVEGAAAKKPKLEEAKEAEKGRVEETAEGKTQEANEEKAAEAEGKPVKLGPKEFASAIDMFNYFYALLHSWTPQLEFNKYEQMVLEDLLRKGHAEPAKKIGAGVEAFEIGNHPVWKSHCFFVRRTDGSVDDFSFRKCVDNILPLPEDFKIGNGKKSGGHQKDGGGGRAGGRRGGGRGGWRGGRGRGRRGG